MTIAVEDIASAPPTASAAAGFRPSPQPIAVRISIVTTTCDSPSPNTSRRMRLRRSNDSSSPMVNRSATTPKAASLSIASTLIANALSQCAFPASDPSPYGPSATPASR